MYRAYSVKRQELRSGGWDHRPTKFGSGGGAIKPKVKTVEIHPTFTDDQKAAAGLTPCRSGSGNLT